MNRYSTLFIACVLLCLTACTDKLTYSALEGTFSGKFYYMSPADGTKRSGPSSISFSDRSFSAQGNQDRIPVGGSGNFEILKDDMLDFKDQNIWTANFDWGLILNGKYKYQFKGDSLILNRYFEPCPACLTAPSTYQYRLKRVN